MGDYRTALRAIREGSTADEQESGTLDFKREGRSQQDVAKDVAEAAACFANSQGGTLVVGIRDRVRGTEAFEGTSLDADVILRRVYQLTNPSVTVHVHEDSSDGVRLLIIDVPNPLSIKAP